MSHEFDDAVLGPDQGITIDGGTVQSALVATALREAGGRIEGDRIAVPLAQVSGVIEAASRDNVSVVLDRMDVENDTAWLVLLRPDVDAANTVSGATFIDELSVYKPG